MWKSTGTKILRRIEEACGEDFTNTAKEKGIIVLLNKKTPLDRYGDLKEENPLEISLYLSKTDNTNIAKELLVRMLVHSFIRQQYEYHFRDRVQTLFEDILADEFVAEMVTLSVLGKKLGRANCTKAVEQAVGETAYRLSQKAIQGKLVDAIYGFFQDGNVKGKKKQDILETREELVRKLLTFLPKNINLDLE
jgi:hypothetical protein